jgi:hypothetical protein
VPINQSLIEAPHQVNAVNIEYSKRAKNIDVRRLKLIMWDLLCTEVETEEYAERDEDSNSYLDMTKQRSDNNIQIDSSLQFIYARLKPPLISQQTYKDLSVSIVFQVLLFLANENVSSFKIVK